MEVAKIRVEEAIRTSRKVAFTHRVYGIYTDILATLVTFVTSERLQLSAWHLHPDFKEYLAHQFVSLRVLLDTKEKQFFLWYVGQAVQD